MGEKLTRAQLDDRMAAMRLYRDQGLSLAETGAHFGVDGSTIRTWLGSLGIPLRPEAPVQVTPWQPWGELIAPKGCGAVRCWSYVSGLTTMSCLPNNGRLPRERPSGCWPRWRQRSPI